MLRQLLTGTFVSVCNIVIHALVMTVIVRVAQAVGHKEWSRPSFVLVGVMVATMLVLMAAHVGEVAVWALAYVIFDVSPPGTSRMYFAFVNYTTLGYGDVLPVERWRLLGPLTATNGMLMFGWSTAVIFEVSRRTLVHNADIPDRLKSLK